MARKGMGQEYVGRNGVPGPPHRNIARRLALSPEAVDAARETLIAIW
jgi:hypothetical protein